MSEENIAMTEQPDELNSEELAGPASPGNMLLNQKRFLRTTWTVGEHEKLLQLAQEYGTATRCVS